MVIKTNTVLIILSLFTILLFSCNNDPNLLEKNTQTIELTYLVWACGDDCAKWTPPGDNEEAVFIEPATSSLILPDTLNWNRTVIQFTGSFYKQKGFPKSSFIEKKIHNKYAETEKSKVFRYTNYKVIRSSYAEYLNLQ